LSRTAPLGFARRLTGILRSRFAASPTNAQRHVLKGRRIGEREKVDKVIHHMAMRSLIRLFDRLSSALILRLPVYVIASGLAILVGIYVAVPGVCESQSRPEEFCERVTPDAAMLNVAVDEDDWAPAESMTHRCRISALA
jgi:hypothetical protein